MNFLTVLFFSSLQFAIHFFCSLFWEYILRSCLFSGRGQMSSRYQSSAFLPLRGAACTVYKVVYNWPNETIGKQQEQCSSPKNKRAADERSCIVVVLKRCRVTAIEKRKLAKNYNEKKPAFLFTKRDWKGIIVCFDFSSGTTYTISRSTEERILFMCPPHSRRYCN